MKAKMIETIKESIEIKERIQQDSAFLSRVESVIDEIIKSYRQGGQVFFAGNGGSAADAQHLAAELVSKFYLERSGLAATALNCNTSVITAIGNDYAFDRIYARQLEANARKGDVFIAISTSGNSANLISALEYCKQAGIVSVGFTGDSGGKMKGLCDILLNFPSSETPRIQEAHIMVGHIVCEWVEKQMFESH